jgi:glycosyltransferase involved in cell wall biosynthesis
MSQQVAMISTYPPTQCGIATFARSMATSMNRLGQDVRILRLSDGDLRPMSAMVLGDHLSANDVPRSARLLNDSDVVILQHEFGIYPGDDGDGALDLLGEIRVPVISVLHTVSERPTHRQRRVMQGLLHASNATVTLSHSALESLVRTYDVDLGRTVVIPHGAPDVRGSFRPHNIRMRPRVLTWGLLSEGKGIEWGIAALSLLRDVDPMPDYFVVGQTHPKVAARDGHRYRHELGEIARRFEVEDRVHFVDGYLDNNGLTRLITSADMYLLPYDTHEQVTSGVLAEAVVAGGPVIATKFPHAVELLGDGTGILVKQQSPNSIAEAIRMIIRDPVQRRRMRDKSAAKASSLLWPAVGAAMTSLTHSVARSTIRANGMDRVSA